MRPIEVIALPHMQLLHLFDEDTKIIWVLELGYHICSCDVLVCCAIHCLSHAIDVVSRGLATT